jgi:hypothetical protein
MAAGRLVLQPNRYSMVKGPLMEPEYPLSCSQEPAIEPYPEPDETLQSVESLPTFQKNMSPEYSGSEDKPKKKPARSR